MGRILDTANSYPMLADYRTIVIKEAHKLSSANVDALARYLSKPSATTKMMLVAEKIDGRIRGWIAIKKAAVHVEIKPLYDNQVAGWVQSFLKKKGCSISYEACLLLHAHVGNEMRALANEIEKLILNKGEDKEIDENDVQANVGLSRKFSVFNLNDSIGKRDLQGSLAILNQMLSSGESPNGILAMITRHFSNLLKVKGATAQRMSQKEITAMTGIPPYFIQKTKEMANNYPAKEYPGIFERLLETDLTLKTSRMSPDIALQTMLIDIMS
jgi:DNA polymerase-3 subunit delta